jgi:hypothetical protein
MPESSEEVYAWGFLVGYLGEVPDKMLPAFGDDFHVEQRILPLPVESMSMYGRYQSGYRAGWELSTGYQGGE